MQSPPTRGRLVSSGETGSSSTRNMRDDCQDIPKSPRSWKTFRKTLAAASLLMGAGVILDRASLSFSQHPPCDNPWRYPEMFYLCPWLRLHQYSQPGNHGKKEATRSWWNIWELRSLVSAVGARKRSSLR